MLKNSRIASVLSFDCRTFIFETGFFPKKELYPLFAFAFTCDFAFAAFIGTCGKKWNVSTITRPRSRSSPLFQYFLMASKDQHTEATKSVPPPRGTPLTPRSYSSATASSTPPSALPSTWWLCPTAAVRHLRRPATSDSSYCGRSADAISGWARTSARLFFR